MPKFSLARVLALAGILLWVWAQPASAQDLPSSQPANELSPEQVRQIERVIHDYLLRNPELILQAVESLEQKRSDAARRSQQAALAERRDEILNDPDSPIAGDAHGDVTIVEFFDYRCPYCKQVEPSLAQLRKDDAKLRFVYKEFPILGPDSVVAARAALAARKQDKYQQLHDALMGARGALDAAAVMKIASGVGLDTKRLKADMADPQIEQLLDRNLKLARALAISGTPGFIVGEHVIPGAVDLPTLRRFVADTRKK